MSIERKEKRISRKAQTAIEYMLLLTICALLVFASFRVFFEPEGRVRNGLDLYFNKVSESVMGPAPELTIVTPTICDQDGVCEPPGEDSTNCIDCVDYSICDSYGIDECTQSAACQWVVGCGMNQGFCDGGCSDSGCYPRLCTCEDLGFASDLGSNFACGQCGYQLCCAYSCTVCEN